MELTKTKLHNILKKYRIKLEQHDKEWQELCAKIRRENPIKTDGEKIQIVTPSIYDHEQHNAKGAKLFKDLMKEFEGYEVFPKKGA
jgi:hypothetical protein